MTIFSQYKQYLLNYNISIVAVQGVIQKYSRFAKLVEVNTFLFLLIFKKTKSSF